MSKLIVQTTNLCYAFNGQQTLRNINLEVPEGSIYGFLGPNGAGKTTTLRLLLGLLRNQQGEIRIFDQSFAANRMAILKRIGSLIEQPSLYSHLSAGENLEIYRLTYGAPKERVPVVLAMVGLEGTGSKKTKSFSLGMKQRMSIAVALLHAPELLILDEPTNGLDPNGIIETRELIRRLNSEFGVTILVSSHILAEVERTATHLGIIHKGAFLYQGLIGGLQERQSAKNALKLETSNNEAAMQLLQESFPVTRVNGHLELPLAGKGQTAKVARLLVEGGIDIHCLHPQQQDLEQLFIDITKA